MGCPLWSRWLSETDRENDPDSETCDAATTLEVEADSLVEAEAWTNESDWLADTDLLADTKTNDSRLTGKRDAWPKRFWIGLKKLIPEPKNRTD